MPSGVLFLFDGEAPQSLPERKTKRFHFRPGEMYLELPIGYPGLLAHELVGPLTTCRPVPLIIDVGSVRFAGRLAVDVHDEPHRLRSRRNSHDEIHVAAWKRYAILPFASLSTARPPFTVQLRASPH